MNETKIIVQFFNRKHTLAALDSGLKRLKVGFATCGDTDRFDGTLGKTIALGRAQLAGTKRNKKRIKYTAVMARPKFEKLLETAKTCLPQDVDRLLTEACAPRRLFGLAG